MRAFRQAVLLICAVAAVACGTSTAPQAAPIVQPGAPGQPSRTVSAAAASSAPSYTSADVTFMQGMIHHHAQALEMVNLLETHTNSADMKKLAQRIGISQADEIGMMEKWLQARGLQVPHHMAGMSDTPLMPGMLTPDQMKQLAAATGPAFDRLFLEFMIQHHAGALTMVKDLFATAGAAQDSDIFAFASDVDADQRAEIGRMRTMLKELRQ